MFTTLYQFLRCSRLPQDVSGFWFSWKSKSQEARSWKYLSGRVHWCTSDQELLDEVHVAFLRCQVQSIEAILEKQ